MISLSSPTASSAPATSLNFVVGMSLLCSFAFDLPNCMTFEPPPWAWLMRNQNRPTSSRIGRMFISRVTKMP